MIRRIDRMLTMFALLFVWPGDSQVTAQLGPTGGTIVFSEDWSNGSIGAAWSETDPGNVIDGQNIEVVDPGTGDLALSIETLGIGSDGWGTLIESKSSWSRGENIYFQFTAWNNLVFSSSGINGGWHNSPNTSALGHELILGRWLADGFENWENGGHGGSGTILPTFGTDWQTANNKANALIIRIWLHDIQGGKIEWSTDQGSTFSSPFQWDTRGIGLGMNTSNFIGFWGTHQEIFVDDLMVVTGGDPGPAPTPTPEPVSNSMSFPFSEDWNSGAIDHFVWTEVDPKNVVDGENIEVVAVAGEPPGDFALCLQKSDLSDWSTLISSVDFATRGNNVRVRFTVWHNGNLSQSGCTGGWHHTPSTGATGHEYILGRWLPDGFENWEANGLGGSGVTVQAFNDAYALADSKANAVIVQVTLDNAQGGQIEWSDDGGATFNSPSEWNELGTGESMTSDNFVGFWAVNQGVFIDDIIVENDLNPFTGLPPVNPAKHWEFFD